MPTLFRTEGVRQGRASLYSVTIRLVVVSSVLTEWYADIYRGNELVETLPEVFFEHREALLAATVRIRELSN